MDKYSVTGMSCAACQARVEKAVNKVPGVTSCSVSLLTNSMGVEGSASPADILKAVEDAGYGAVLRSGTADENLAGSSGSLSAKIAAQEDALKDRETPLLKKRLIASVGFLLVLMYFSMGHMMWGWPLPAFFKDNHVAMGLVQASFHKLWQHFQQLIKLFLIPSADILRGIWIQHSDAVRNDACAGGRGSWRGHELHDGVLL